MLVLLVLNNLEIDLTPKFGTLDTFVLMATSSKASLHVSLLFNWEPFTRLNSN